MKLLRLSNNYPFYLKEFFLSHPELSGKSFAVQKAALDYDAFGWPDSWKRALEPLGYRVEQLVCNAESIQKTWAQENGINYSETGWLLEITRAQIQKFRPDILFINDYVTFSYQWITELRQQCPFIKLVVGWCGAPYHDDSVFKAYDVVLSCIPELVEIFRRMGHASEHVHHAFDPAVLERLELNNQPKYDFSFVGQIVRGNKYHLERERILEGLVSQIRVKIFSPSAKVSWQEEMYSFISQGLYGLVQSLKTVGVPQNLLESVPVMKKVSRWEHKPLAPVNKMLKSFIEPPVFGLKMFQTLYDSKVTFNNHIDISPRSASNMRLFEATGVGTCLVTDWKENIRELFEPDSEVVTFKTVEECVEKVRWLIDHPQARQKIAQAGQARVLQQHTFRQRAALLDKIIRQKLA